jgi:hypothetical protein
MIKPEKLRSWIEQVEDEETSVQDYDFLNHLTHGGPEHNGSGGLANVGAYLAIHEEDGEIVVEEDLVEALDERQSEESVGKRFRNIVYDAQTSKREGNTLYDRGVKGHEFLEQLATEFERNVDLDSLPSNDESVLKAYTQNHSSNDNKGGDNSKMTDDLYNNQLNTLAGKLNEMDEYSTEVVHAAARLERQSENVLDAAEDLIDEYRETGINVQRGVQSWVDEQLSKLEGVDAAQQSTISRLNSFENDYLSGDYGISDSAKDAFSDAAGYDITQDL